MYCPECGNDIPDKSKFCFECGTNLSETLGDLSTRLDSKSEQSEVEETLSDEETVIADDSSAIDTERYVIQSAIGKGGMGTVYKAQDNKLGRTVAIKKLFPTFSGSEKALSRFMSEARSLASLSHQNIVQIFDVVEDPDGAYIVMEYIEGGSLQDHLSQNGKPDEEEAVRIFVQICTGLAHAHKKNIVHRDIKPPNVLLALDGTAKLTDFGIARMAEMSDMTMTGATIGTPIYMSPEQERDAKHVDLRADIYSLGATFYELLTGDLPRVINLDKISNRFRAVIGKTLEKSPESRYQNIGELLEALETVKEDLIPPKTDMLLIPAGEFLMGARNNDEEAEDWEKPQLNVYLDAYYIGKYPVTVAEYKIFCKKTNREMPEEPEWGWKDDHPVVNVNCDDAVAYCRWAGGRLPTEAEWEKASRGTDGRTYPWGGNVPNSDYANYDKLVGETTPVGSYPKGEGPYGVLNMAGNVWDWCSDWYDNDYYKNSPEFNPEGPSSGSHHVIRGGSWFNGPKGLRTFMRAYGAPDEKTSYLGFRLARTP